MSKLITSNNPQVTPEFLKRMRKAFPNKRPDTDATIGEIQRQQGQLDVVDWVENVINVTSKGFSGYDNTYS